MRVSYTRNLRSNTDLRIQSVINILTEAYDYVRITEAVPYSVAKKYLQIERSPEAEARIKEVFSKLKSLPNARQLDKRGYRIAFPYAEDSTEFEIQAVLEPYNFSIKDYKDGVAFDTKNNREIKIGRALDIVSKKEPDAKELIDRYADIKSKGATSKDEDLMMVFSSAKYDLAGMSTGRKLPEFGDWDSCMNVIEGENSYYVRLDIREGSIICYLTTVSDTNIERALGRILIKPYINSKDKKDVVLYPELKTYGKIPNTEKFIDEVDDYMEKTQKLSGSYERLGCLYRDSQRDEIESKYTIRTRALKKLEDEKELTDAEFLSLPLKNKRKLIDTHTDNADILNATRISFASESQKKKYIRLLLKFDKSDSIEEPLFLKLSKELKYEIIDYKIKKFGSLEEHEFQALTPEQEEKYIDSKLSEGFRLETYEFKALTPEKKEKYIDWKLSKGYELSNPEFKALTPEKKEKYIDWKLSEGYELHTHEFQAATQKQKEKHIDWKLNKKGFLYGYETEAATPKQKEKYIDSELGKGVSLLDYQFKAATQKQKEKYIDWKLNKKTLIRDYEFEAATLEQKDKYIDWKLNKKTLIRDYEFEAATPEQKDKYIDWILSNKGYELLSHEFQVATQKQKEKYINYILDRQKKLKDYELEAATPEQKERYKEYAKN